MGDDPRSSGGTGSARPGGSKAPGAPRWVRVCAVVAGAVLVLLLVLKLAGVGGEHGPGRHVGVGDARSSAVVQDAGLADSVRVDSWWR